MKNAVKEFMNAAIAEFNACQEHPKVGVVIVKNGTVLATGRRGEIARMHAERIAIEKLAPDELLGATLYTTLEPCVDIFEGQGIACCADLIGSSGIREVVIGVLDPNGSVYTRGFERLRLNGLRVSFFPEDLRELIEEKSFSFGEVDAIYGSGSRRVAVVQSGSPIKIGFSIEDARSFLVIWQSLQPAHGFVDLVSENRSVTVAAGARHFADISDPTVFRFPSHYARMKEGDVAIVRPEKATFCALVRLAELHDNDIVFQLEVRNLLPRKRSE